MAAGLEEGDQVVLLRECRTVMCGRMRRSIGAMLHQANDVLSELALKDGGNVADSPYFDAIREIQSRRREIELRFENRFTSLFDDALSRSLNREAKPGDGREGSPVAPHAGGSDGSDEAVSRIRASCRQSLLALDKRVSTLLNRDMYASLNPMRPELVYEAFRGVCGDLKSGDAIQQVLLGLFERYVALNLEGVYREVDSLLARSAATAAGTPASLTAGSASEALSGDTADGDESNLMLVKSWVESAIRHCVKERPVPRFITEFIDRYWRVFLQQIYVERGHNGPDWDRAMRTLDELVLSVQQLDDPESRRRMVWLLPSLVYRLKSGMRAISVPVAEQRLFLKTLKACHVHVVERRAAGRCDSLWQQ